MKEPYNEADSRSPYVKRIEELEGIVDNLVERNDNQFAIIQSMQTDRSELLHALKSILIKAGVDFGWGSDEELGQLEEATASAMSELVDIKEQLDVIRTQR